jgi:hypothetical protein
MKKALSTRQITSFFPSWSEIRNSWQSVGTQYLNTLGVPCDDMDEYLEKMRRNSFLSTVNLDEIDWVYKVELPATYSFILNTTDALIPSYAAPTVRGLVTDNTYSGYMDISLAPENKLEEMWYEAIPSRVDLEETENGSDSLLYLPSTYFPYSGMLEHHISDGGRLWVEMTSGVQYVSINEEGAVDRGKITLTGTTRKGTKETETLVFPWDMKQPTLKEWKSITRVEVQNLEDEVSVEIRSGDFNWGPYLSFYNLRWSDIDTKIDEFWDIGTINTGTTLDLMGYISDEWQNIMLGFSDVTAKDRWELINIDLTPINAIDLAVQPFTNKAWVVDSSHLYCFSLEETMVSGVDFLAKKTAGSNVKLESNDEYYVAGDDILFTPLHARPTSQIDKYRIWYSNPAGTKYGLDLGAQVSYTSDFWQYPTELKRELEGEIVITPAARGEYQVALEAVYPDGTTHSDRLIIPVKYKQPLVSIDISDYITGTVLGVDFDSDQQLWVKTTTAYYRFSLHADLMIVNYKDKVIYFREEYKEVDVT